MNNPYQILGVSEAASMDEVKKAYRKLSRIYHPDANINNPNKDQAEAKFKEIQAAYQQIVNEKENGGRSTGSGYGQSGSQNGNYSRGSSYNQGSQGEYQQSYGGFEDFFGDFFGSSGYNGRSQNRQDSQDSTLMQAAGNYLRNGYYREAYNVLNNIPEAERNAKWYYYSAQANAGTGNNITALEHAQRAVQLEPGNYVYQELLRRLQSGETRYNSRGGAYGRQSGGMTSLCFECLMLNLFCNCCCRC